MSIGRKIACMARAVAGLALAALACGGAAFAQVSTFEGWYGNTGMDQPRAVIATSDGAYLAVGHSSAAGGDIYAVKTDRCGVILWSNVYDLGGYDFAHGVRQAPNGSYIVVGNTTTGSNNTDAFLMEIRVNGTAPWAYTYGTQKTRDEGHDLCIDPATSDVYVAGFVDDPAANVEGWIFKTDGSGAQTWSRTYGGDRTEYFYGIVLGCTGSVIATGQSNSHLNWSGTPRNDLDVYTASAATANGNLNWAYIYGRTGVDEWSNALTWDNANALYVVGAQRDPGTTPDTEPLLLDVHCAGGYLGDERYYNSFSNFYRGEFHDVQMLPDGDIVTAGLISFGSQPPQVSSYHHLVEIDAAFLSDNWSKYYPSGRHGYSVAVANVNPVSGEYNLVSTGWSPIIGPPTNTLDVYLMAVDENGNGACDDLDAPLAETIPGVSERRIYPTVRDFGEDIPLTPDSKEYGERDMECDCTQSRSRSLDTPGLSDAPPFRQNGGRPVAVQVMAARS